MRTADETRTSHDESTDLATAHQRRAAVTFNGVKVFSATTASQRAQLGDVATDWLARHNDARLRDISVTQSSDAEYHCITITFFYWAPSVR